MPGGQFRVIGTGIEEAINELAEEEEQSFDMGDQDAQKARNVEDDLYDDDVVGEIGYGDDDGEDGEDGGYGDDDRREHMPLRNQRVSDASSDNTSLASLLMMNEIPQYGNSRRAGDEEQEEDEFKIEHSSQDDMSSKRYYEHEQPFSQSDSSTPDQKLGTKVSGARRSSEVAASSGRNLDFKGKNSQKAQEEVIVNYFD